MTLTKGLQQGSPEIKFVSLKLLSKYCQGWHSKEISKWLAKLSLSLFPNLEHKTFLKWGRSIDTERLS